MQKEKYLYLESLRGFAAIIVAIFHAQFLQGTIVTDSFLRFGYLMVDFFFVLSGFVIAYNYADKIKSLQNLWVFQARRFLRLYPLHILTFIVFVGIECAKYFFEQRSGIVANNPAFSRNDWGAAFNHIFLTHSLFEEKGTFNEPSWSISAEFYTYLVFGLVFIIQTKIFRNLLICLLIVIAGTYPYWQPVIFLNAPEMLENFFRCIYCFFIGVIVFKLSNRIKFSLPVALSYISVFSLLATLFFRPFLSNEVIPFFYAVTILGLVMTPSHIAVKKFLEQKIFVLIGALSYGIYMWHEAVWWIINNGLRHIAKVETILHSQSGKTIMILSDLEVYSILSVGLIITIIISYVSYRLIEMPINNFRHKLRMK